MIDLSFKNIVFKSIIVHTASYFIMGILAMNIMNYSELFNAPGMKEYMRPIDDSMVKAGILFQPIRGFLFGLVFYFFKEAIFLKKDGWKGTWLMLSVIGIFSTFGPAPGSIEGLVYTKLPIAMHLRGLPEVIIQSFLLAYGTYYWVTRAKKGVTV